MLNRRLCFWMLAFLLGMTVVQAADAPVPAEAAVKPAAVAEDVDEADDEADAELDDEDETLPPSPLTLVGGAEKNLGTLNEASQVEFTVEAENTGKEPVFFKRAMSTCACLKILEAPTGVTVAPGGRFTVKAVLYGNRLGGKKTNWNRGIFLEAKGYSRGELTVTGAFVPMLSVFPDSSMYLGKFEGVDVPWTRTFTIQVNNPEANADFAILPPAENKRFDMKLTQKDSRSYQLEIRPKLPMKPGKFTEKIFLPVPKMGKDMGVRLRVFGEPQGRQFQLSKTALAFKKTDFDNGMTPEASIYVSLKQEDMDGAENESALSFRAFQRRGSLDRADKKDVTEGALHVTSEEKEARKKRTMADMEKILSIVTLEGPEWATITRVFQNNLLVFNVKVLPDFLKLTDQKGALELKLNGVPQRKIEVRIGKGRVVRERRRRLKLVPAAEKAE